MELPLLDPSSVELSTREYLNRTRRIYLPVPALPDGGELLLIPNGFPDQGKPIKSKDPDARGYRFQNWTDSTWQGVRADGKCGIAVNDIRPEQAASIISLIASLAPELSLTGTATQFDRVLESIRTTEGCRDFYNTNDEAVLSGHVKITANDEGIRAGTRPFGFWQVAKTELHRVAYIEKGFRLESGPVRQYYPSGGIILSNGRHRWGIASDVFIRNFRRAEGREEVVLTSIANEFGA